MELNTRPIEENADKPPSNFARIENRMRRAFRIALMASFLGHAPAAVGSFVQGSRHTKALAGVQNPVSISMPGFFNRSKNGLIEFADVDNQYEKQKAELINFQKALEIRENQRAKNRNPEKIEEFKRDIKRRLESHEYVSYVDFIFSAEETVEGIDHAVVENAKRIFFGEMEELKKQRPSIPDLEFLDKVVNFTEINDSQPYEPTQTHVSVYLNRKGKNLRGNCQARAKYVAMALEYLYPEYRDGIRLRDSKETENEGHMSVVFTVNGKAYLVDKNPHDLTDDDISGTALYSLRRFIEDFAGIKNKPVKIEKVNGHKKKAEAEGNGNIDYNGISSFDPPQTDNKHFPNPTVSGEFEVKHKKKKHNYYSGEYRPPEIRELEAEEKKKGSMKPAGKESDDQRPGHVSNEAVSFEVSDFQTVFDSDGRVVEVLPWKPIEYSYDHIQSITQHIQDNMLPISMVEINAVDHLRTPSMGTIHRINDMVHDSAIFNEVEHYSQEALEEIMSTKGKRVVFDLAAPHLPTSLRLAFARKKNFFNYAGTTVIIVHSNDGENYLPLEELALLMPGKGILEIHSRTPKSLNYEELVRIFGSERPAIDISGMQCPQNTEAIVEAGKKVGKPKTFLIVSSSIFIEMAFRAPVLLDSLYVGAVIEFAEVCEKYPDNYKCILRNIPTSISETDMQKTSANSTNLMKMLFNVYLLRFVIESKYGQNEKYIRVDHLIELIKKDYKKYEDEIGYDVVESEAKKEFELNGINAKPKKTYEFCPDG
jgi:hypothetical protein